METTKENIENVLNYFCDIDNANELLNAACFVDGKYYATNTNALIEITTDIDLGIAENAKNPNFKRVIPSADYLFEGISISSDKLSETLSQLEYFNVYKSGPCDECKDGEFDHGSHTYECKKCDGSGYLDGDIVKRELSSNILFMLTLNGEKVYVTARILYYLRTASALLNVLEWKLVSGSKNKPLLFVANNVKVILMSYLIHGDDDYHTVYEKSLDEILNSK